MVAMLGQWFQTLILVMILASLIEMLLPSRSMERYVRLVLSLTVLMAILSPVFHMLNSHWFDEEWFKKWYENSGVVERAPDLPQQADPLLQLQQKQAVDIMEREMEKVIAAEVESRFPVDVERVAVTAEPPVSGGGVGIRAVELVVRPSSAERLSAQEREAGDGQRGDAFGNGIGLSVEVEPVDIRINLSGTETADAPAVSVLASPLSSSADAFLLSRLRDWLAANYELDEERIAVSLADGR